VREYCVSHILLLCRGTDAREVLLGKTYTLSLGYVGVVSRSQEDILTNKSVGRALEDEAAYFRNSVYSSIASQQGTHTLALKCAKVIYDHHLKLDDEFVHQVLYRHIRESLPDVKNQVRALIKKTEAELEQYGMPIGRTKSEMVTICCNLAIIVNLFSLGMGVDGFVEQIYNTFP
jgi:dynamin 1-like protein